MNLRKRTLALLLTVCLLLSVMVPMVSAASLYTQIWVGSNYADNYDLINPNDVAKSVSTKYLYLFNGTAAKYGRWAALRIKTGPSALSDGKYNLSVLPRTSAQTDAGISEVYLLPDTTATDAALTAYINENMNPSTYRGLYDSRLNKLQDFGTVDVSAEESTFLLVFKPTMQHTKYRCHITHINLVPVQTAADADSLATVLTDIADNAGGRFSTIKLTGSFAIDSVTIPANVTIDLNGNTLTATNCTFNGKLADSLDGTGLYKSAPVTLASNDLLLYDSEKEGYRVYNNYTVAPYGEALQTIDSNTQKLWIKASFANTDAYRVIATGNSGFEIGAALSWTPDDGTATTANLVFGGDVVADWAAKMEAGKNVGFYIQFTGFDNLPAGKLKLTPFVNEVSCSSATSISYTKAAG